MDRQIHRYWQNLINNWDSFFASITQTYFVRLREGEIILLLMFALSLNGEH